MFPRGAPIPKTFSLLGLLAAQVFLFSCSSAPRHHSTDPVHGLSAISSQEEIAASNSRRTVRRLGTSRFDILPGSREAYEARLAVVEAARYSLDFQYFIWKDDSIGTLFAERLLAAADRGVKVRLLLDVAVGAQNELRSAYLAAHPNIDIAYFNPMTSMSGIFAGNPIPVIGEIDRMQSRMHNKVIVADNTWLIGGGRNLADEYFGVSRKHNVRDLDFIATGSVVAASKKSFDLYWTSPITQHGDRTKLSKKDHAHLKEMRQRLSSKTRRLARENRFPFPLTMSPAQAATHLQTISAGLITAPYEFVADPPERMLRQGRVASPVWGMMENAIALSRKKVLVHAAYLIPQQDKLELFQETTGRGVSLTFLTNSLASVDGMPAMTGIAGRRGDVIDSGATLAEMKGNAASRKGYIHRKRLTPMGMHSKGMVVDERYSFIGSYNMDPRSQFINTETGIIVDSSALASRLTNYLNEDLQPENCWMVTRDPKGGFLWSSHIPGKKPDIRHHDPDAPVQRRILLWILRRIPWENAL